jgi:endonuclease YncB( thermonuclease family)
MAEIITGKEVQCVQVGGGTPCDGRLKPTSHKRIVAQSFVDGKDSSKEMVCSGHAVDWPKFSGGYYQPKLYDKDLSQAEAARRIEVLQQEIALADSF